MPRKICVTITARPSYSRIKTALQAIQQHPDLQLQVVLAGSALLSRYGDLTSTLEKDGIAVNEKVHMLLEGENSTTMAKTTGLGLIELSTVFQHLQPDAVLVVADRYETIAVSIAAAYQNIPLIHVQGGEITGNIDEKVRHANTKLADIHFTASDAAKERVIRLGEDPEFVFNTGCPSIDIAATVLQNPVLDFDPYSRYGGVGAMPDISRGYIVAMQHPVTTEYEMAKTQVINLLEALYKQNLPVLWFWPNADAGADGTSQGIRAFRENHALPQFHFFKNMQPDDFLKLLYQSKCLVGNSSVGIRECSYLGIPVVNIGSRQQSRDRASNVTDVPNDSMAIQEAIKKCITESRPVSSHLYGDGNAGKKIAAVLSTVPLRFHKKIMY